MRACRNSKPLSHYVYSMRIEPDDRVACLALGERCVQGIGSPPTLELTVVIHELVGCAAPYTNTASAAPLHVPTRSNTCNFGIWVKRIGSYKGAQRMYAGSKAEC